MDTAKYREIWGQNCSQHYKDSRFRLSTLVIEATKRPPDNPNQIGKLHNKDWSICCTLDLLKINTSKSGV